MTESESVALPFGDSPILRCIRNEGYYTRTIRVMQVYIDHQNTCDPITIPGYPDLTFLKWVAPPI